MLESSCCTTQAIEHALSQEVGATKFNTWFRDGTELQIDERGLCVWAKNRFVGNWISSNFLGALRRVAARQLGDEARIDVRVRAAEMTADDDDSDPDQGAIHGARPRRTAETHTQASEVNGAPMRVAFGPSSAEAAPGARARASSTPRAAASMPSSRTQIDHEVLRGRLEQFVVGGSNRLAFAAAQQIAAHPGEGFCPLVIHGGCGLGKTHLLQGICNAAREQHPLLETCYISGEQFTNQYISAVKSGRIEAFRNHYRAIGLLVIDDIHFLANKRATQEEFLHTFDAVAGSGRTVVLSSDRHPREISTLSESLVSRLIAGIVVETTPPDFQVRVEILRRRARECDAPLADGVLELIARRVSRNVRELEGALLRLIAMATLGRESVTAEFALAHLADYVGAPGPQDTLHQIEDVVGRWFDVTPARLRSMSRSRNVSLARAIAMYLARQHTTMSYPEISRAFGKPNHSTAVMAVKRLEDRLAANECVVWRQDGENTEQPLREVIERLTTQLEQARNQG